MNKKPVLKSAASESKRVGKRQRKKERKRVEMLYIVDACADIMTNKAISPTGNDFDVSIDLEVLRWAQV
jgi:hypothetical protein